MHNPPPIQPEPCGLGLISFYTCNELCCIGNFSISNPTQLESYTLIFIYEFFFFVYGYSFIYIMKNDGFKF